MSAPTNGAARGRYARRRTEDADWLSLVEPVGQFLTAPVLRSAFPEGLPAVPAELRAEARERLADVAAARGAAGGREAWLDWLCRVVLGWGDRYRTGDEAAAVVRDVPEYRTTLRADGLLRDPNGTLRALVVYVPFGTRFDSRLAGEEWSATPLDRITELARAHGVPIALLSDAERVALVNVPIARKDAPTETTGGYVIWQTALFAEGAEREYFAAFVALLHAQRFFNAEERQTLEALFERSALTQADLTKTLGLQVRKAVELMVGAFSRADRERRGELLDVLPPHVVYEAAATVMMRLVFMLYAEERDLLPIGDPTYAEYYAVSTLRDQLEADAVRVGEEPLERRASAWRRLLATFNAIYSGIDHDRLKLPAYGGRLFDPARFAFLEACRVDDLTTRAILTSLQTVSRAGESRRLSFLALDVEQIGHVYEGLLDHDAIRVAEPHLGFDGKSGAESEIAVAELESVMASGRASLVGFLAEKLERSEKAIEKGLLRGEKMTAGEEPETRRLVMTACESDKGLVRRVLPYAALLRDDLQGLPTVYPAGAMVVTKTRARRDSGTEYTPRVLAEEIVRYALEPLVYSPGPIDGASRELWQVRSSAELLALKICDPACGSGAFLVAACRYLAERVAEAWQREERIADDEPVRDAQRIISERCLYGVDRDPMAVEMAKLSLWLLTFARQRPFGFLDHAIREGDSLLGITSLDQLRTLHFNPERGRALHDGTLFDVLRPVGQLIDEAVLYRLQLQEHPTLDIADAQEKAHLESLARAHTGAARLIADAMTAIAIANTESSERDLDSGFAALGNAIREAIGNGISSEVEASLEGATRSARMRLDGEKPERALNRRPLHWPLEYPEIFTGARHGFDLVLGNPPFLGGKLISGRFGTDYRSFLVIWLASGIRGNADLVAYFFLQAAAIARRFSFIATNTIGQGDTREVALDVLLSRSWLIGRAEKSRAWPGAAAIQVAEVWCHRGMTAEPAILEGTLVPGISALLVPNSRVAGTPYRLTANSGIAYQGTVVLGLGFILTADRARQLIKNDSRNREIIFPYITAEDICGRSDFSASRQIINFGSRSKNAAATFSECFAQLMESVKPERQRSSSAVQTYPWWLYWRPRKELYQKILSLSSVIVIPRVSKYTIPILVPTGQVYSDRLAVIASDSKLLFGILSSQIHQSWARNWGTSHETRPTYFPTKCFETFPRPSAASTVIEELATALQAAQVDGVQNNGQGLTALYNRLHNRDNHDADVIVIRELQIKLDHAVLAIYGWQDIELGHDFRASEEGLRLTICERARLEILDRLLELNHTRHATETESRFLDVPDRKSRTTSRRKLSREEMPGLLELK